MFDAVREAMAGAFAGTATKTLMAPLDRLKLVVQLRGSLGSEKAAQYEGPLKALTRMIKQEGFLALWRGNMAMIWIQGGSFSLNFMFLDLYKKLAVKLVGDQQPFLKSFASGALAGGTSMTLLYPFGLMRTKLALDMGHEHRRYPNGMRDVIRDSIRTNGFTSLFQGYSVALMSVTLYRMVYLGGYDYIKGELVARQCDTEGSNSQASKSMQAVSLPFEQRFIAAQSVSMLASTIHYPLDSVRRRLMMQSDAKNKKYRNGWQCFVQIYQQEGIRGYYRGLGTNYIRSIGAALLLVSYDFFNGMLMKW